jgi:hypothetical protein
MLAGGPLTPRRTVDGHPRPWEPYKEDTVKRTLVAALLAAGLNTGAPLGHLPACKYEDGSGQKACVWDAKHMGNGSGRSGVHISFGDVWVPVSHKTAHRLLGR